MVIYRIYAGNDWYERVSRRRVWNRLGSWIVEVDFMDVLCRCRARWVRYPLCWRRVACFG